MRIGKLTASPAIHFSAFINTRQKDGGQKGSSSPASGTIAIRWPFASLTLRVTKGWARAASANDAKPVDDLLDASDLPGTFLGELFVAVAADVAIEDQHAFCKFASNPGGCCEQTVPQAAGRVAKHLSSLRGWAFCYGESRHQSFLSRFQLK
jgi:hypothetical protein